MIHYVVDHGAPQPIDDDRCRDLKHLGFRRDGAYLAGPHAGEVWIDADGSTMVAVAPLGFGMTVAAQTVLEDGTHVTTEARPPLGMWLFIGPGVTVPPDRTSLRFPRVRDAKELIARHREHVAEVVTARGAHALRGGTTARYVETRNDAQLRAAGRGRVQSALAALLGLLGALGTFAVSHWLGTERVAMRAFAAAVLTFMVGFLYLAPAILHTGLLRGRGARVAVSTAKRDEERVLRVTSSRVKYILVLYVGLLAMIIGGMAIQGVAAGNAVLASFSLALMLEQMSSASRNRLGRRSRPVAYELAPGELRIEGERPIPTAEIAAVLRTDIEPPSLAIVDRRGQVRVRLTGPAAMLDELRDALALDRVTLPVTKDPRYLLALAAPLVAALAAGWALPAHASAIYSVGAVLMMLAPLVDIRRRPSVEVGVDGMFLQGRFVAFADVARLATEGERLQVEEKNGTRTALSLALVGSAAELARRWHEHSRRVESRDADVSARRRIAVAADEEVPYRVRIASPDELGEMLLDSSEDKSVRVRAARRLALSAGEDAARIREDVQQQVVDPDVRQELLRTHE